MSGGESPRPARSGLRFRLSLLNLLLVVTITALSLALWRTGRELIPLRDEVQRLRDEAGYINLTNPDHVHAVRVWTPESSNEELVWRWKVYVPAKGRFYLHAWPFDVPEQGVPQRGFPRSGSPLEPGETVFELRIVEDPDDPRRLLARLRGRNDTNVYGNDIEIKERRQTGWARPEPRSGNLQVTGGGFLERQTIHSPPAEPVVLLRLRPSPLQIIENPDHGGWSPRREKIEGLSDGLIIWISNYER